MATSTAAAEGAPSSNSEETVGVTESVSMDIAPSTTTETITNDLVSDTDVSPTDKVTAPNTDSVPEKTADPSNIDTSGHFNLKCQNASKDESSECNRVINDFECMKFKKVDIYVEDTGPKWHKVYGNIVTPPFIPSKLVDAFDSLPIFGKPDSLENLEAFQQKRLRDFIGFDLNDDEFQKLADYCSPDHLKTGKELVMLTSAPNQGLYTNDIDVQSIKSRKRKLIENDNEKELCVVKKYKMRLEKDYNNLYPKRLKYRGVNLMPLSHETPEDDALKSVKLNLEPGKDILIRVRIYRPFPYNLKERPTRTRHSVFSCDVVLLGRQTLADLRDRIVCANDLDMRVDVSENPYDLPTATAMELFPSGFLFVNNAFYVDERPGCRDTCRGIREWAQRRGLGHFPREDMAAARLDSLRLRLGHPEVYVHQGNCEHLFTISEVRLLTAADPLKEVQYPCHTAISQNQTVYCTTCAEFCAKWIAVGCLRVPFDPAFFCDPCLKLYMYSNGQKLSAFKAYSYRANEINMLKPLT